MRRPRSRSTLFPYTTLFRSQRLLGGGSSKPAIGPGVGPTLRLAHVLPQIKVLDLGRKFRREDRKSTRLNSSHLGISYAVFCLKKKMRLKITMPPNEHRIY